MRVLVITSSVPFLRGGGESHVEGLVDALVEHGHEAELVALPFRWYPGERILDQILAFGLLDASEFTGVPIDRVIVLKFPSYLLQHDAKVLWMMHQQREAADLWGHEATGLHVDPLGAAVREAILAADRVALSAIPRRFAISQVVAERLRIATGLDSEVLHPPVKGAHLYRTLQAEPFVFFPSRVTQLKRQGLVAEAIARTSGRMRLVFAGAGDSPYEQRRLDETLERLDMGDRVSVLGHVDEETKRDLYARCTAVAFTPVDEDFGYITAEAMYAGKPVITCTDSGGPLELVMDGDTGVVVPPDPDALATVIDEFASRPALAAELGRAGRERIDSLDITWTRAVDRLLQ